MKTRYYTATQAAYFTLFVSSLFAVIAQADTANTLDSCLLGNWKTDPALQKKSFEYFTGQRVNAISGIVRMRLNPDGNGKYQLEKLHITSQASESGKITARLNGISSFTWRGNDNRFSADSVESAIKGSATAQFGELEIPLPEVPFNNGQWPSGRAESRYVCSPQQLTFHAEYKGRLVDIVWQRP